MAPITALLILIGSVFVPLLALLAAVYTWSWRTSKSRGRGPVSEPLMRPPGESLRLKIDELSEQFGQALILAIVGPGVGLACVLLPNANGQLSKANAALAFLLCAVLLLPLTWRAFKKAERLRNYRLGFHGERAVGEELNQLMREGCRVFHDVPIEPYGNIDHVVVSSAGVFSVETKTRRKRTAPNGKRDCDAVFDGEGVEFPTWRETEMVKQTRMQGERLRSFLTKAVGEPVSVLPVLTLPGWFVTMRARPDGIRVLNPRQIASVAVEKGEPKLSPQMIQRIAFQLEQKCRDVVL